jgi:hypothetical protein
VRLVGRLPALWAPSITAAITDVISAYSATRSS